MTYQLLPVSYTYHADTLVEAWRMYRMGCKLDIRRYGIRVAYTPTHVGKAWTFTYIYDERDVARAMGIRV